jgi:hypothetical protein
MWVNGRVQPGVVDVAVGVGVFVVAAERSW